MLLIQTHLAPWLDKLPIKKRTSPPSTPWFQQQQLSKCSPAHARWHVWRSVPRVPTEPRQCQHDPPVSIMSRHYEITPSVEILATYVDKEVSLLSQHCHTLQRRRRRRRPHLPPLFHSVVLLLGSLDVLAWCLEW